MQVVHLCKPLEEQHRVFKRKTCLQDACFRFVNQLFCNLNDC